MNKKLTGVLIDTTNKTAQKLTIADELNEFYNILKCRTIDIVTRNIGAGRSKKAFDIICDDEGLCNNDPLISAINNLGTPMLVGNLFITGTTDTEGNLTSLSESDIQFILKRCQILCTNKHLDGLMMLTQCEY
jgi:hypothetical protein